MEQLILFSIDNISYSDFTVSKVVRNISEQQKLMINSKISKLLNINNDVFVDFLCTAREDKKDRSKNYLKSEFYEETYIQYDNENSNWLKNNKIVDLLKLNNYYFTVYHQLDLITSIILFSNNYINK